MRPSPEPRSRLLYGIARFFSVWNRYLGGFIKVRIGADYNNPINRACSLWVFGEFYKDIKWTSNSKWWF